MFASPPKTNGPDTSGREVASASPEKQASPPPLSPHFPASFKSDFSEPPCSPVGFAGVWDMGLRDSRGRLIMRWGRPGEGVWDGGQGPPGPGRCPRWVVGWGGAADRRGGAREMRWIHRGISALWSGAGVFACGCEIGIRGTGKVDSEGRADLAQRVGSGAMFSPHSSPERYLRIMGLLPRNRLTGTAAPAPRRHPIPKAQNRVVTRGCKRG